MALGTLVIRALDQGSSLAVRTTATADLDAVAREMTMLMKEAGSIFTLPARWAHRGYGGVSGPA